MSCSRCGAPLLPGSRFCHRCRKRADAVAARPGEPPPAATLRRPGGVAPLAGLDFAAAALWLLVAGTLAAAALGEEKPALLLAASGSSALLAFLSMAAGIGLLGLRPYGRRIQLLLSWLALPVFPLGTLFAVLVLSFLLRRGVKTLFSGRAATELTPQDAAGVRGAERETGLLVAGVVVGAVGTAALTLGVLAAVALPRLEQARAAAEEGAAVADVRAVMAAESAYAAASGGHYDRLECLADPAQCLSRYPPASPRFLSPVLLERGARRGFAFTFYPGPPPATAEETEADSPSSMTAYAYVAAPLEAGAKGRRWFCGDGTGRLCTGKAPAVPADGLCPLDCEAVP